MSLGIGIIGTGVMGADHARILRHQVAGAELVALADTDGPRAAAVAAALGVGRVHADGRRLIEDPAVDAVLVAAPDAVHGELVLACLAAGKPVLCEKPLAPTAAACRQIMAAEERGGRRLVQVGFMRRFDPAYRAMKQAYAAGELGTALLMHCIHRNAAAPPFFTPDMPITNSAVHEIDIRRWLLAEDYTAVQVCRSGAKGGDGLSSPLLLLLTTSSGVLIDIEVFVNARYGYDVRAELVCEAGTVTLAAPADIRLRQAGREAVALAPDWRPRFAAAYRQQAQAWVDALRGAGPADGASAWDGFVAIATAAACVDAAQSGRPVPLQLPPQPEFYRQDRPG